MMQDYILRSGRIPEENESRNTGFIREAIF